MVTEMEIVVQFCWFLLQPAFLLQSSAGRWALGDSLHPSQFWFYPQNFAWLRVSLFLISLPHLSDQAQPGLGERAERSGAESRSIREEDRNIAFFDFFPFFSLNTLFRTILSYLFFCLILLLVYNLGQDQHSPHLATSLGLDPSQPRREKGPQ